MKHLLFALALTVGAMAAVHAQGNLQFNDVKFIEMTLTSNSTTPYASSLYTVTVPSGKVWKIESTSMGYSNSTITGAVSSGMGALTLNDKPIHAEANFNPIFPIWLGSGTYIIKLRQTSPGTFQLSAFVSALEFNIVP